VLVNTVVAATAADNDTCLLHHACAESAGVYVQPLLYMLPYCVVSMSLAGDFNGRAEQLALVPWL
jgi:hypothetical protein